ncbi:hypothetical protein WOLCODRAFT_155362 [Wolfiporia cocos MD-104 SS10]|uniref:Uncharacterized protein n=1 Tax=Wolfiporia cocos (strain MD-104) TaxID=742152 RepID=A0A2H3JAM1_WOLCO|nr:hypothetical protein WOLCODRAFT_155362 [Wolfiporia cocos MD-104 SS10]
MTLTPFRRARCPGPTAPFRLRGFIEPVSSPRAEPAVGLGPPSIASPHPFASLPDAPRRSAYRDAPSKGTLLCTSSPSPVAARTTTATRRTACTLPSSLGSMPLDIQRT